MVMAAQMVVTIAGVTKVSNAENAPYKVETVEGVTLKVWDRDGIVSRIMGLFGQPVTFTYRDETRQYNDRNGNPRTGVDHVITGVMPGGTPAPQMAPAVQASPQVAPVASVAAQAQPASPVTMSVGLNWDAKDYSIWRQTAMKIVGHHFPAGEEVDLADCCAMADCLVHYFETGRLPDKLTDGQHKAIEALCGRLDTLEPTGAPWRDRVKRQLRKQYGREVPSMNDVRAQEAAWLIDVLQAKVNTHDNPPPPPPPPPADPIGQNMGEMFPGSVEVTSDRPMFSDDESIPF